MYEQARHGIMQVLWHSCYESMLTIHIINNLLQAVELLREVTGVEPAEYDRQQAADAAGVKNVAIFLTELSCRHANQSKCIHATMYASMHE